MEALTAKPRVESDQPPGRAADPTAVAAAYDSVASDYDRHLARDAWSRRVLWRHFRRRFRPGDHVLDAGCGTGIDTLHLAERGIRVTAVDVSPGMLAELRKKLVAFPYASRVDARLGDLNQLAPALPVNLDGIVSSFAALNTVDIADFGRQAARLLRPGGHLLCHMLSPGYLNPAARAGTPPAPVNVNGTLIPHLLLGPRQLYARFFAADFVLRRAHALGFLVRPAAEKRLPPGMLDALGWLESILGGLPGLASRGRFFVLDLERRHVDPAPGNPG